MPSKKITVEQFQDWFGSDHCERWQDLTNLLLEIANGEYTAEELNSDVASYTEGETYESCNYQIKIK